MRDHLISPSGWIFADLLLGLLVIFMAVGATDPSLLSAPAISVTSLCENQQSRFEVIVVPVTSASGYELFRDGASQGSVNAGTTRVAGRPGESTELKVRAVTPVSAGPFSNVVAAVGVSCVSRPQPPSIAVVARCEAGGPSFEVSVSPVDNANRYELYRDGAFVQSVAPGRSSALRGLTAGQTYSFTAKAANDAVQSEFTPAVSAVAPTGCSAAVSVNSVCRVIRPSEQVRSLVDEKRYDEVETLLYGLLKDLAVVPGVQAKLALTFFFSDTAVEEGYAEQINRVLRGPGLSARLAALGGDLLPATEPLDTRANGLKRHRPDHPGDGTVAIELFLAYGGDTQSFRSDEGCSRS